MSKKQTDYEFGKENENYVFDIIKKYFNDPKLTKTYKFNIIDFYSVDNYFELKSRKNTFSKYPTTICGLNKITYFKKIPQNSYLLFYFTDGLYYIKYDEHIFNTFEIKDEYIIRDGKKEFKKNIHIPITHLIKIV